MLKIGKAKWLALEFKLEDMWIGAFWTHKKVNYFSIELQANITKEFHLWVCILPCLPIHFVRGISQNNKHERIETPPMNDPYCRIYSCGLGGNEYCEDCLQWQKENQL